MSRVFAIVESGVVTNLVLGESWPGGIDVTALNPRPRIGWLYSNGTFTAPPDTPPPQVNTSRIHKHQLIGRMTPLEWHRWRRFAQRALDAEPAAVTVDDRRSLHLLDRFMAMDATLDMSNAQLTALGNAWVELGITTAARAQTILAPYLEGTEP